MLEDLKQYVGISSWFYSTSESNAMWKIYSKNNGIAVKTTVDKLYNSFQLSDQMIHPVQIQYEHYGKQNFINDIDSLINLIVSYEEILLNKDVQPSTLFYNDLFRLCLPLFHYKRRPFWYENEYRFITLLNYQNSLDNEIKGNKFTIEFNQVIDEIHLSPDSEYWFYETIKNLLDTYNIDDSKLIDPKMLVESKL